MLTALQVRRLRFLAPHRSQLSGLHRPPPLRPGALRASSSEATTTSGGGALKAFLAAAGGWLARQRPFTTRCEEEELAEPKMIVEELRRQKFILRVEEPKLSPLIVDDDGEMYLQESLSPDGRWKGPWDLNVTLAGDENHPSFFLPLRLSLRFLEPGKLPVVRLGGQLAFPLVGHDRRLPKIFWTTFKNQRLEGGQSAEDSVMVELLDSLRRFLLDPAEYLGYTSADSPEARRLENWMRDVTRLNGQRLGVIKKYRELCRHEELFDPLSPLKEDWFHPDTWSLLQADPKQIQGALIEHLPGEIYSFPLFTEDFCDRLLEEIFNFYESGLPARRPNSMNNYGIILTDIGLEPFVEKLQGLLQPMGEELFPGPGSCWDGHHCFIVRYREGWFVSVFFCFVSGGLSFVGFPYNGFAWLSWMLALKRW